MHRHLAKMRMALEAMEAAHAKEGKAMHKMVHKAEHHTHAKAAPHKAHAKRSVGHRSAPKHFKMEEFHKGY